MRQTLMSASVVLLSALAAFGHPPAVPLKLEVASIKPSDPPPDGHLMIRMGGSPGRLDYRSVSLKAMLQRACDVWAFQISGPDWMASTRFDMVAKLPEGAPQSAVPEMLRWLLAERFQMSVHREMKESSVYALVVGKGGVKMKQAEAPPSVTVNATPPSVPGMDCGPAGERVLPAGWYLNKGPTQFEAHGVNMVSVAKMLGSLVGRPVLDRTGLEGAYDFTLAYDSAGDGVSIFTAIQEQLGLKLEAQKAPVEWIVVDHAERAPAGN